MSVPEPAPAPEPAPEPRPAEHRTRLSGLWIALGCSAIVVVFLLIFILQNDQHVSISYLGFHVRMQLGIALLFGAIGGILLTVLAGSARILQLRAAARRRAHAEKTDPTRRTASRS